jgi:hypothetical protein
LDRRNKEKTRGKRIGKGAGATQKGKKNYCRCELGARNKDRVG